MDGANASNRPVVLLFPAILGNRASKKGHILCHLIKLSYHRPFQLELCIFRDRRRPVVVVVLSFVVCLSLEAVVFHMTSQGRPGQPYAGLAATAMPAPAKLSAYRVISGVPRTRTVRPCLFPHTIPSCTTPDEANHVACSQVFAFVHDLKQRHRSFMVLIVAVILLI